MPASEALGNHKISPPVAPGRAGTRRAVGGDAGGQGAARPGSHNQARDRIAAVQIIRAARVAGAGRRGSDPTERAGCRRGISVQPASIDGARFVINPNPEKKGRKHGRAFEWQRGIRVGSRPLLDRAAHSREYTCGLLSVAVPKAGQSAGSWNPILVGLPGGYFYASRSVGHLAHKPRLAAIRREQFSVSCRAVARFLNAVVIAGVDGPKWRRPRYNGKDPGDQLVVAWTERGPVAVGRKVFPTEWEADHGYVVYAADPHTGFAPLEAQEGESYSAPATTCLAAPVLRQRQPCRGGSQTGVRRLRTAFMGLRGRRWLVFETITLGLGRRRRARPIWPSRQSTTLQEPGVVAARRTSGNPALMPHRAALAARWHQERPTWTHLFQIPRSRHLRHSTASGGCLRIHFHSVWHACRRYWCGCLSTEVFVAPTLRLMIS